MTHRPHTRVRHVTSTAAGIVLASVRGTSRPETITVAVDGETTPRFHQRASDWIPLPPPGQAPRLRVVEPATR